MLFETITYTSGELNAGSGIIKQLEDVTLEITNATKKEYRPVSMNLNNTTGADLGILLLSDVEYEGWQEDSSITDYLTIENNQREILNDMLQEVRYVVVEGVGGHSADLKITFIRE